MGNHVFHCWRKGGHGAVNLHKALVESCDVYFYEVGQTPGDRPHRQVEPALRPGRSPPASNLDKETAGLVASTGLEKGPL